MDTDNFKTMLVVNPRSANGRTGNKWDTLQKKIREFLPEFDYEFTQGPMDAARIARESLKSGYEMVVTVGGDGTNSEVVNGFFENGELVHRDAVLGVLPRGTGCDFVRTLGIPKPISDAAAHLPGRYTIPCDAGHITYMSHSGEMESRYFINLADFGMGGDLVNNVNNTTKFFGAFISFFWGMMRTSRTYKNKAVRIEIDGQDIGERTIKNVIIANGRYCGGGMRIAKDAILDDGLFDILVLGDFTFNEGARMVPKIYSGEIVAYSDKVEFFRAKELRATSDLKVLLDVDGEQPGILPATLTIIPRALRVKVMQP